MWIDDVRGHPELMTQPLSAAAASANTSSRSYWQWHKETGRLLQVLRFDLLVDSRTGVFGWWLDLFDFEGVISFVYCTADGGEEIISLPEDAEIK